MTHPCHVQVAHAAVALFAAALVGISYACGNFDIISGHTFHGVLSYFLGGFFNYVFVPRTKRL